MNSLELRLQHTNQLPLEPINVRNLALMKSFFVKRLQNKHEFEIKTLSRNHAHSLTLRSKLSDLVYPIFFFYTNSKEELEYFGRVWDKFVDSHLVEPLCVFSHLKKFSPHENIIRKSKNEISYLFEYLDRASTQQYIVEDMKQREFRCYETRNEQPKKRSSREIWKRDAIKLIERELPSGIRTLKILPSFNKRHRNIGSDMYQESFDF